LCRLIFIKFYWLMKEFGIGLKQKTATVNC
jgi:hypothetical protein